MNENTEFKARKKYDDELLHMCKEIHGDDYEIFYKYPNTYIYAYRKKENDLAFLKDNPFSKEWLDEPERKDNDNYFEDYTKELAQTPESLSSFSDSLETSQLDYDGVLYSKQGFDISYQEKELNAPSKVLINKSRYKSKIHTCTIIGCSRQYKSVVGLKYHIKNGHKPEKLRIIKPYACKIEGCDRKYKNSNGLQYHLNIFHNKR